MILHMAKFYIGARQISYSRFMQEIKFKERMEEKRNEKVFS